MAITKTKIGEHSGQDIYSFRLECGSLVAEILNYGGIVKSLIYNGVDVVLGRDTLEDYLDNTGCFGATIGRNSNRIENAEFSLSGKVYKLFKNNGRNNLHGGKEGFDKKVWGWEIVDSDEPSLALSYISSDGEEGFPFEARVKVTFTVTKDSALKIHYEGDADGETILNMTNHSYFNLNGHDSGTIDNHTLSLDCDFYTPNTDECMPTGEVLSVKGTPFDFSTPDNFGERFAAKYGQLELFGGFDHNFALNGRGYRKIGTFCGDKSGIKMEILTDLPAVQLYSGNWIDEERVCKGGAKYKVHGGLCFETQVFPNNLKFSHFPSSILKEGEKYDTTTTYRFI